MQISKLKLSIQNIAGDSEKLILTGVNPYYEYGSDGNRTNKQLGYAYNAVSAYLGYEPFRIKVPKQKPIITQEEINSHGEAIFITCQGFEGKLYRDSSGAYQLSATAESVELDEAELTL